MIKNLGNLKAILENEWKHNRHSRKHRIIGIKHIGADF